MGEANQTSNQTTKHNTQTKQKVKIKRRRRQEPRRRARRSWRSTRSIILMEGSVGHSTWRMGVHWQHRKQMANPTNVARAIMRVQTATSRGTVLRFAEQQASDRKARQSQGTLHLRLLGLTLMQWMMFHYKNLVPMLLVLTMQKMNRMAINNPRPASLLRRASWMGMKSMRLQQLKESHNMNVEDIIILEVCAGSARLTKIARAAGFKGVAMDHSTKRSCGVDICVFDLTDPSQLSDLLEYITRDADRIALIWIAPSCGTASRARERPFPGVKSCPKPLRSVELLML